MADSPRADEIAYLEALKRLTPEQRLERALELNELARDLLIHALRRRFPEKSPEELQALFLERLDLCHNSNY
ncbi:MAG: hypothetical protein V1748_07550 [Actinomycetota bacterium]